MPWALGNISHSLRNTRKCVPSTSLRHVPSSHTLASLLYSITFKLSTFITFIFCSLIMMVSHYTLPKKQKVSIWHKTVIHFKSQICSPPKKIMKFKQTNQFCDWLEKYEKAKSVYNNSGLYRPGYQPCHYFLYIKVHAQRKTSNDYWLFWELV